MTPPDPDETKARELMPCTCFGDHNVGDHERGPWSDGSHFDGCPSEMRKVIAEALRQARRDGWEARDAEVKHENRRCRMQRGPDVPWWLGEILYRIYSYPRKSSSQSLERLSERGGLGWGEISILSDEIKRRHGPAALDELCKWPEIKEPIDG